MSDAYHDIQEMFRYSDHFVATAASYTGLHPFVTTLVDGQKALLEQLRPLRDQKQASSSTAKLSRKDQQKLSGEVHTALDALYPHLEAAEKKGIAFDFTAFFPRRVREDIGKSVADRQASLERCVAGLKLYPQIPDATAVTQSLTDLHKRFTGVVTTTSTTVTVSKKDVKSFMTLRKSWKRHWLACKRGMESVLLLADREDELKLLFLDLQVASPAKKAGAGGTESGTGEAGKDASSSAGAAATAPTGGGEATAPASDGGSAAAAP